MNKFFYKNLIGLSILVTIIFCLGTQTFGQKNVYSGRYALVIGNVNYQNFARLGGVAIDVQEVSKALKKQGFIVEILTDDALEISKALKIQGFNVKISTNDKGVAEILCSQGFNVSTNGEDCNSDKNKNIDFKISHLTGGSGKELQDKIDEFCNNYGYDLNNGLIFYFAGHGYTDVDKQSGINYGYFVPIAAPNPKKNLQGFQRNSLEMSYFKRLAIAMRAKHILFVFDSCFSGSLIKRGDLKAPDFCPDMLDKSTRQFITSGTDGQTVPDQSIFRKFFVEGLNGNADLDNDGLILGSELAEYLSENVIKNSLSPQTPQYSKFDDPAFQLGEMVFLSGKPFSSDIFQRTCNTKPPPPPPPTEDKVLRQIKPIYIKTMEALKEANTIALNSLLADEFITGLCQTEAPVKKATYLKTLKKTSEKIIKTERENYTAEKLDDKTVKLELNETYLYTTGKSEKFKIIVVFRSVFNSWKLYSINFCQATAK